MNLQFGKPVQIETASGIRYVERATPTPDFWKRWRFDKSMMSQAGISVMKINGHFVVQRMTARDRFSRLQPVVHEPYMLKTRRGLLPYQPGIVSGLCASLMMNGIAIDGSEAGCGKTYTSIAVCREFGLYPGIVCTKAGIPSWKKVCAYMGVKPFFIMNWEGTITRKRKRRDGKYYTTSKFPYCKGTFDEWTGQISYEWTLPKRAGYVLIFDEVHKGNGNGSEQQKVLLAAKDYPLIALSATIADKVESLKPILTLCNLFPQENFEDFLRDNGCYLDQYNKWTSLSPEQDMLKMGRVLFPAFGARIRKKDIPGFPDIQNIADVYSISKVQQHNKAYEDLLFELKKQDSIFEQAKAARGREEDKEKLKRLQVMMATAQANKLTARLRYRQFTELLKVDLFAELVREHLDNNMSVVLFLNFTETIEALSRKLKTKCIIWGAQQGREGSAQRQRNIEDFQADRQRVMLANIQAGGISISLHDLNGQHPRTALISPTDSAIVLTQAMGRIHRAGAKSKAINKLVYAAGTVEEEVCRNVSGKLDCIAALNDGDLAEKDIFKLMKKGAA